MKKRYWAILTMAIVIGAVSLGSGDKYVKVTQAAEETAEDAVSSLEVTMSEGSGCYEEAFSLGLTCERAEKIYYTTDGSNPSVSSTREEYTGVIPINDRRGEPNVLSAVDPVLFDSAYVDYWDDEVVHDYGAPSDDEVDKATVIKAVAVDAEGNYGSVVTNTYFVGAMSEHIQGIEESCEAAGVPLSILSISVDYQDLFDYEKGIYVKGKIFDEMFSAYQGNINAWNIVDISRSLEANYNQRGEVWERNAHLDYLESDGASTICKLQQDCGIRIQGNYSRSDLQKGFRLYARNSYGEKNFNYAFFGEDFKDDSGQTISKFKKLTLRNGGNASFLAKYNDAYWQSLLRDTACETQGSRVCVVYLDGEYWGIYILQEEYDDNYFENKHGVDKDTVVVYKGDAERYEIGYTLDEGTLPAGVTDESYYLRELIEFFQSHSDLKSEADYQAFEKLVDVDSVRDFFAAQIWINNKWDWPGKNWSMWKTTQTDVSNPYADGKWRLCFYDLDFGGWSGSSEARTNTIAEDNYKPYGLLDMNTGNPTVLCFAYLMTNEGFRASFAERLQELSSKNFEKNAATAVCQKYRDTYQPLYLQFFNRFFRTAGGEWRAQEALYGAGSYQAMTAYVGARAGYIDNILKWVDNFYKTHTVYNSGIEQTDDENGNQNVSLKKIGTCKVTAKKGKKSITVKTIKKASVKIAVSKKIILSGGKKVKTITIPASKNKKGTVSVKLASKLKKGIRITVTVKKSGYQKKSKSISVA